MTARALADQLNMYFVSMNSIPIERATIKTTEWQALYTALMAELDAQQAKIDALMLEFCPEDMTPEQLAEWGRHQRPVEEPFDLVSFITAREENQ